VLDLWRRKDQLLADNRSFLDIVKGVGGASPRPPDAAASTDLRGAPRAAGFGRSPRWPMLAAAAVSAIALSISIYCAAGYSYYKHIAETEHAAAQRAERANSDLQAALERMRDEISPASAIVVAPGADSKPSLTTASLDQTDRASQMASALERRDPTLPASIAKLSRGAMTFRIEPWQQIWASVGLDETEKRLQELNAEYEDAVSERDRLKERANELEQRLSVLMPSQAPDQAATASQDGGSAVRSAVGAPAIDFPASGPTAPAAEQARRALKNFTTPRTAPDYFSNESGAILDAR
jgi:cell division septum initiation protein DivIVA